MPDFVKGGLNWKKCFIYSILTGQMLNISISSPGVKFLFKSN